MLKSKWNYDLSRGKQITALVRTLRCHPFCNPITAVWVLLSSIARVLGEKLPDTMRIVKSFEVSPEIKLTRLDQEMKPTVILKLSSPGDKVSPKDTRLYKKTDTKNTQSFFLLMVWLKQLEAHITHTSI